MGNIRRPATGQAPPCHGKPLACVLKDHVLPQGGDLTNCVPTITAKFHPAVPVLCLELLLTAFSQASVQNDGISLQLFHFLVFQKLRSYFSIRAAFFFFFSVSEIPQGISRKIETFDMPQDRELGCEQLSSGAAFASCPVG